MPRACVRSSRGPVVTIDVGLIAVTVNPLIQHHTRQTLIRQFESWIYALHHTPSTCIETGTPYATRTGTYTGIRKTDSDASRARSFVREGSVDSGCAIGKH